MRHYDMYRNPERKKRESMKNEKEKRERVRNPDFIRFLLSI
jgi:hypothetical protein